MSILLDKVKSCRNGIHFQSDKSISLQRPLMRAAVPAKLIIPLKQHQGKAAQPIVKTGSVVYKGQCVARQDGYLSAPVHASSSGTVADIGLYPGTNPQAATEKCIVINTDQRDQWHPDSEAFIDLDAAKVYQHILTAGVVGMGGDGVPSAVKLLPREKRSIALLILNATECEPYVSCDTAAIQHAPQHILAALELICDITKASSCVIAVCDTMPTAITALQMGIRQSTNTGITISQVAARYPAGEERQLIRSLTGIAIPAAKSPFDAGILVYNVGTMRAIYNAVFKKEPLIHRLLTVTGPGVDRPGNVEVLIGTPIREVIAQCGGYNKTFNRLILGGPMRGFVLHNDRAPVTKMTNCLLAADSAFHVAIPSSIPCIRCGSCVASCPVDLLPYALLRHAQDRDSNALKEQRLFDCIECGCCAYVCPSQIPLVEHFYKAKNTILMRQQEQGVAALAKDRFEKKQRRKEGSRRVFSDEEDKRSAIAAAVRRVREKRRKK